MGWSNPPTAVVGDFITAAFWNTGGRDNLNYLFGTQNGLVAATIQVKQLANTLMSNGIRSIGAASGTYAAMMADDAGNAYFGNNSGKWLSLDQFGNLKRWDGASIFPGESGSQMLPSSIFGVSTGIDVINLSVTTGGVYTVSGVVLARLNSTGTFAMQVSVRDTAAGGGSPYANVMTTNTDGAPKAVIITPFTVTARTNVLSLRADNPGTSPFDVLTQGVAAGGIYLYTQFTANRFG